MTKEPTSNPILPEIKRRKRKVNSEHALANISYQSLYDLYIKECKLKGLSETTISGYMYTTRYFLDILKEFLYDCTMRKLSERTIKSYRNNNLAFIRFIIQEYEILEIEDINHLSVKGYI